LVTTIDNDAAAAAAPLSLSRRLRHTVPRLCDVTGVTLRHVSADARAVPSRRAPRPPSRPHPATSHHFTPTTVLGHHQHRQTAPTEPYRAQHAS
jgi:hypothetical protein